MGKLIDLTGQKFGRLTVIKRAENKNKKTMWLCLCECGNYTSVASQKLLTNHTKSCGCLQKEIASNIAIKTFRIHGMSKTRLYNIWQKMKERCYCTKSNNFKYYGARDIAICKEWLNNPILFYNWALDNGYNENLTIDRIDVNGNYEPSNYRWVNYKVQCNNKRTNHLITYRGKTLTLTQWANELGINKKTLSTRLCRGWSFDKAIEHPI